MNAALLLHGDPGLGLLQELQRRAAALLCEAPNGDGNACGSCASCRLLAASTHPDFIQLLPPALALALGLVDAEAEEGADKKNPSKEISIDQVRRLVDWSQTTSHRGGAKVVLLYPLESLAGPAANALLKTLEEPPPSVHFLIGSHRIDRILPTLRSRCRLTPLARPTRAAALAELQAREVDEATVVADWCRDAVFVADPRAGLDWALRLLESTLQGRAAEAGMAAAMPEAPVAVTALQRIVFDLLRVQQGLQALHVPQCAPQLQALAACTDTVRWLEFARRLEQASALGNFPLNAGLNADNLVLGFQRLARPRRMASS